jgi:hypothetical protein
LASDGGGGAWNDPVGNSVGVLSALAAAACDDFAPPSVRITALGALGGLAPTFVVARATLDPLDRREGTATLARRHGETKGGEGEVEGGGGGEGGGEGGGGDDVAFWRAEAVVAKLLAAGSSGGAGGGNSGGGGGDVTCFARSLGCIGTGASDVPGGGESEEDGPRLVRVAALRMAPRLARGLQVIHSSCASRAGHGAPRKGGCPSCRVV